MVAVREDPMYKIIGDSHGADNTYFWFYQWAGLIDCGTLTTRH